MDYLAMLFSLLFFSLVFIYLYWGISIIKLNPKESVHRVFLAICLAMSIWSLGFAMANSSLNIESALFWRRFAALGWSSVYALILHFLILLTNEDRKLKKKGLIKILYIPALVNLYVFAFSNKLTQIQYNLKYFDYGWINMAVNNAWDYFFYTYYAVYIIIGIVVIIKWEKNLKNKSCIKQGYSIVLAFFIALLLGSGVDLISNSVSAKPLPQMAPLFILLPTWVLYYSAKHYGVMDRGVFYKEEVIVSEMDRERIFKNISIAFYAGAILAFVAEYFPNMNEEESLKIALINSLVLMSAGLLIRLIQRIKNKLVKETLTIMVLVINIPIITFQFLKYGGLTVWVYPLAIIIVSLTFSKRTLLISTTIVAIITQRVIWILHPEVLVIIDKYDYILRIGLFILAFLIGYYVNKIYVSKIMENKKQFDFQKLNSDLSLEFVNVREENIDEKIDKLLMRIGAFFQVDRVYVFLINHTNRTMTYSYEWCNEGINPEVGTIDQIPLSVFPWWIEQLEENKLVYIEDVNVMPEEAREEQAQLIRQEVKSLVSVPIEGPDNLQGFIGIDSVLSNKKWPEEKIKQLNILANLISNGLEKTKSEKQIEFMAFYDGLTKLPNRFLFKEKMQQAMNLGERNDYQIAIIFIDLDDFKSVNDTIGHEGGDGLLREVGERLSAIVRKTDTVARFAGDEFMIMLNQIEDYQDLDTIADKIMAVFSEGFKIQGQVFFVTASAGISLYPDDGKDVETLIKNADSAMYKAKNKGKNQYVLCTSDIKDEIEQNVAFLNDLRGALERDEFVLYYQPQLDSSTGKINGLEALIRWVHPEKGIIAPRQFISLAEQNGLINSIGEWVLKTACVQNKKWQDMNLAHVRMGVNLSVIQLINPDIIHRVEKTLKESNLEPEYLELEITESIAIRDSIDVGGILKELKQLGVKIAIDDFGTEYSSLSRLKELPIDRIKIDMQFTQGIDTNEKDRAITKVIINLAKSLELNVIAEGVETEGQEDFLNQNLCDDVQGFYYHKPMPAEKIEKILRELG